MTTLKNSSHSQSIFFIGWKDEFAGVCPKGTTTGKCCFGKADGTKGTVEMVKNGELKFSCFIVISIAVILL